MKKLPLFAAAVALIGALCYGGVTSIVTPPGGSDTDVQYNNNGRFGGSSSFTYNGSTVAVPALSVSGNAKATGYFQGLGASVATSNDDRGALFLAAPNDYNHALFNNRNNIDSTVGLDAVKWNEPSGWNFRLGANSSRTPGLLLDADRVLTYRGAITGGPSTFGAALQEDANNPITFPNSGGSSIAESLFVSADGGTCYDFYTNNSNSHVYFASAVDPKCQAWTLENGGAPLDATNSPLAGYTYYTQVIQNGTTYYMTASTAVAAVALFYSTDGGHWSRYQTPDILTVAGAGHNFTNVALAIDGNNVWHMLVEDYSGSSPFAHIYYSSAAFSASMNFDTNFHATPVFAGNTGNPVLLYVPDRSALLAIYGDVNHTNWTLRAKYALLSSDLGSAASWVDAPGFFRYVPGVDVTDPAIVFSSSPERGWGVMLHYNYAQFKAHAAYGNVTLDEFYDMVTAPTSVSTSTVRLNLTGQAEADAYNVGHFGVGQMRADSSGKLGLYTGPGYADGSLSETVLVSSYPATTSDIPSAAGGIATPSVAVTTVTVNNLTASRVVVTDSTKRLASSAVTSTTLAFLDATSSVQTQMDAKAPINNAALTGTFGVTNTDDTDYNINAQFLTSNLGSTHGKTVVLGKAATTDNSAFWRFKYHSTASSQTQGWGFYGQAESLWLNYNGTVRMSAYGAGAATFDASGNITSVSDERAKERIVPFTRGLSAILAISPKKYHYRASSGLDTSEEYTGFTTQDVGPHLPEAVFRGKGRGAFDSLWDRAITAALVNSVKELSSQDDSMKKQIEALKARLDALEKKGK